MKNVAKNHHKRKFFYWLSLGLILISCFSNVDLILENKYVPNFNESIVMHSSNKSNYPPGISHIVINNNWTETEAMFDWCNGSGSWDDPYIIYDILLDCEEKGSGILVNNSQSSYFVIQNCTFYNCSNFAGIKIENSVNGQLFDNNLSYYNQFGVELVNVDNSSFFSNDLFNNEIGILIQDTNGSTFYQNTLFSNSIVGINITSTGSESNSFYNNNFTGNGINVYDAGTDSEWDNGSIGNFWDDYGGVDLDDNGLGDTPYFVDGPASSQDNYPIWNDGDDIPPILTVISPNNNTICSSAPQINISAYDINLDSIWYLIGGSGQIEELQNETAEFLLSIFWSGLSEGKFNVSFYANDTSGNINEAIVLDLYKDTTDPTLTIDSPGVNTYWNSRPNVQATVTDTNFESVWYVAAGTKIMLENGVAELLNQSIWDGLMDEETFTIYFYANDSVGNVNSLHSRTIHKDITDPILVVNLPGEGTYWNTRPNVQASAADTNLNSVWYIVNGDTIILENGIAELLNQSIWDGLMDEETFTIYFYANDSAGNVNSLHSRTIHKDITNPTLTINLPVDDTYWNTRPNVQATAADTNFDSVWYVVNGIEIILENGVAELLNQSIWEGSLDEETFTIYFYANDSAGNVNSLHSRTIHKDITDPILTVNLPVDDNYWNARPNVQVTATDTNFDSVWYVVAGTKILLGNGVAELLDQGIWDGLIDEETFTIYFYANDSAGNVNSLHSRTIHKDITDPTLTINLPVDGTYWNIRPNVQATASDTNFDSVWYVVNGIEIILENGVAELLNQSIWDGLMDEETFTIYFYANDSAGNINSLHSRIIHKDITDPTLTVNLPLDGTFWNSRPNLQAIATDLNFDAVWYVVDGTKIILENGVAELLNQSIWDGLSAEETFIIYFYGNDSAGNVNSLQSRTIHKDITDPTMSINLPVDGTYWNIRPNVQATASDTNFDSVWYVVNGIEIILENGVAELLNQSIWDALSAEETFTIYFYANDSAGNINSLHSRTIHKDITDPTLTINLPADGTYWNTRPNVQATAADINLDSVWYVVNGVKIILENGVAELLNQSIWDGLMDEETFTIYFSANDSAGNVNSLNSLTIHKDITDPTLTVNLPIDGTYWNIRPNVQATAADAYFDSVWYVVNGIKIILENGVAELLNQSIWDGLLDEETFTIYFYGNDSAGNVNSLHSRTIYKDIKVPIITVNNPSEFDVFGLVEPICSVDFYDLNGIDQSWYQLTNGSLSTSIRQWTGSIDANDWDFMPNGTVSLLFYANDSLGNIGFISFTVYKDIISPSIIIHSPEQYDLFGIDAPNIDLTIYDPHLETVWYELDNGTMSTGLILWTDTIDGAAWDLMGNGTVTIEFTAIDSVFNIADNNVIVRKNIHDPVITILQPADGALVGVLPPVLDLYIASAAIDSIWYYLTNGSFTTDNTNWTGNIDESLWNLFGDGELYIYFFINDTLGNLGSDIMLLLKDITAPSITINSPDPFELFGTIPPVVTVQFNELNIIDQTWYQLYSSIITTPVRNWGGDINQNDWNLMPNGTITIIFFANDSVGNLRSVNVSVYRDILEPHVNIYNPDEGDLYGSFAPLIYLNAIDPNGISQITYQLSNGTITTPLYDWNGTIDQDLWAQFGNGSVTVYVFANDTLGNVGFDSIFLRKDIIAPSINIQLPLNFEEVGRESPFFEVYMTDANIDTAWYRIMGTSIDFIFTGIYGKIDQDTWENLWDVLSENSTIIIRFYGNDTMGNLDYEELILLKPFTTNDIPLPTFPFDFMQIIPLSIVIGSTAVLSVAIRKSRFYSGSDEKHKKFINRMLILTALLVTLITAAVLTQSL